MIDRAPKESLFEALAWLAYPRFGVSGKSGFCDVLQEWKPDEARFDAWGEQLSDSSRETLRTIIKLTGSLLADAELAGRAWVSDLSSAPFPGPHAPEAMDTARQLAQRLLFGEFVEEFIAWRVADAPDGPWQEELALIRSCRFRIDEGLSEEELIVAEEFVGAAFPSDLRSFLSAGLPIGRGFPNWRRLEECATFQDSRLQVYEDLAADLQDRDSWWPDWGEKPADLEQALALVKERVDAAPPLIPVYSHRRLPAQPCVPGNPIFSVYGADAILYGADLSDFLYIEFGGREQRAITWDALRPINFWTELVKQGL